MVTIENFLETHASDCFFGSSQSVFTLKNGPVDPALSSSHRCSSLGCIFTLDV